MAQAGVRWVVEQNNWPKIVRQLEDKADLIVRKTAMDLEAQAKVRAAVDTGIMRGSIQASRVAARHWRVTVGAEYGIYVEYGTRFAAPQPFMDPAVQAVWPAFQAAMRTALN